MATQNYEARYTLLDLWRGVAALMVVFFHASGYALPHHADDVSFDEVAWPLVILSRFSIGVTLFFVISGYCIVATADSSLRRGRGLGNFAIRRLRRIYPPFWASLAFVALVSFAYDYANPDSPIWPQGLRPSEWFTNITLTHTWLPNLFGTYCRAINGVSWSLCYEEQFYLVCGLSMLICPRRFILIPGIVTVASLVFFTMKVGGQDYRIINGTFLDYKWLQFALGGLLYYRLVKCDGGKARAIEAMLFASPVALLTVIMGSGAGFERFGWSNPFFQLFVASTFAMVLLIARGAERRLLNALSTFRVLTPLHYLGRISYSLYLVHALPVILITGGLKEAGYEDVWSVLFIALPVCTGVSVALAGAFYWAVERFCLNPAEQQKAGSFAQPCVRAATVIIPTDVEVDLTLCGGVTSDA